VGRQPVWRTLIDAVTHTGAVPLLRVAVVGAGVVGAATAQALAAAGAAVTVVDADRPGAGTSATSLAWLNANQKPPREYHDFSVRAMREWRRLAAGFGRPDWYVPTGNVTWAATDAERRELSERVARLRDWEYPAEHIDRDRLRALEPALRVPAGAGIAYFPDEAFVHTEPAVDALVADARAHGAAVLTGVGAVRLESSGGRVTALRMPDGARIRADVYVCCAGWRTPHLLAPHSVPVPLVPGDRPDSAAPGLVAHIDAPGRLLGRVVHAPDLSLRPDRRGLRADAEDINRRVHVATSRADRDRYARDLADRAERIIAGLSTRPAVTARVCVRPLPVDGKPVVGWLPQLTNAYLVVCHSGVTLAPLLGRLVATELTRGPDTSLDHYRITRFG
jgi:glycine/D-amino acid oxidase-like deaminating enzyme